MENDGSFSDTQIDPDPNISIISSLRKDNLLLQTKIDKLQFELKDYHLLDEKNRKLVEELEGKNSEINDLKCRLQISINQTYENKKQLMTEQLLHNEFFNNETKKLKNKIDQLINENKDLSSENKKLEEKAESLLHKLEIENVFNNNQNRNLLISANSFFKIDFQSIDQLKNHFLNNSFPFEIISEKEKKIESQISVINKLKNKLQTSHKECENLLQRKKSEIDKLNQRINKQNSIIEDLNLKIKKKTELDSIQSIQIQKQAPKQVKWNKFASSTITIIPSKLEIEETNQTQNSQSIKLIESLNETILHLKDENRNVKNDLLKYQIQLQKLKDQNKALNENAEKEKLKFKLIKKEFEIKLKNENEKVKNLKLSSKIPDPLTEKLISDAKNKIRQQKETIGLKESQLSKLRSEVEQLNLLVSNQKIEIIRLKAELTSQIESSNENEFINQNLPILPEDHQKPTNLFVFNYSELKPKLRAVLSPIIDNCSLSIESKLQIGIRKVDFYYKEKLERLKKFKKINFAIENFINELFQLLIGRTMYIDALANNANVQSQIIESIKENKRKFEEMQISVLNQNKEINQLKTKLTRSKEKLASNGIRQRKLYNLKFQLEEAKGDNDKLKDEIIESDRKIDLLKKENSDLLLALENERNNIIMIKQEQTNSLGEYEQLVQKMKNKCNEQRKTIKCLSGC